jgi:hypothetical protein
LIVTEFIVGGSSIKRTYGHVSRVRGADNIDIVALGKATDKELCLHPNTRLTVVDRLGQVSMDGYFFGYRDGSKGVIKNPGQPFTKVSPYIDRQRIGEARDDVRFAARLLYPLLPQPAE